jgi:hypothetical protein
MARGLYRLNGHEPVKESDLMTWAKWFESADRIVVQEFIGAYWISTVFLGSDHNWTGAGRPMLFETMVFGDGGGDIDCRRCSTWDEAELQHAAMCAQYAAGSEAECRSRKT